MNRGQARAYRTGSATGTRPLGIAGRQIELRLTESVLMLRGESGAAISIPVHRIARLRIGADYGFNALLSVDPHSPGPGDFVRRHIMSIHVQGYRRPLRIITHWRDTDYRNFALALANAVLTKNGRVERGVSYFLPLFFAAILIAAIGRGVAEAMADEGRLAIIAAAGGIALVTGALSAWTSTIWWPRGVAGVTDLDTLRGV